MKNNLFPYGFHLVFLVKCAITKYRPAPSGVAAFESEKCAESVQAVSAAPQNKPSGDSSRGLFYCLEPLAIPSVRERTIPKNKWS